MESLARLLVAVTELFEAEGYVLKRQFARFLLAAGLGLLIVGLCFAGLGFLVFGLFRILATQFTPIIAALTMGVAAILLAWAALSYARRLLR